MPSKSHQFNACLALVKFILLSKVDLITVIQVGAQGMVEVEQEQRITDLLGKSPRPGFESGLQELGRSEPEGGCGGQLALL